MVSDVSNFTILKRTADDICYLLPLNYPLKYVKAW